MVKVNTQALQEQANRLSAQRDRMSEIEERLGVISQRLKAASSEFEPHRALLEQKRTALRREIACMGQCITVLKKSAEEYRRCEEQLADRAQAEQTGGGRAPDRGANDSPIAGGKINWRRLIGPVVLPGVLLYDRFRRRMIWLLLRPVGPGGPRLHPGYGPQGGRRRFRPSRPLPACFSVIRTADLTAAYSTLIQPLLR